MGLTFASGHVFTGCVSDRPDSIPDIDALDTVLESIGYKPIEDEEPSECDLAMVATENWFSFFDPSGPGIITADFAESARALSAATKRPLMLMSVYDSDEFAWLLFDCGKLCDGYATHDDLLPMPVTKSHPQRRADRWNKLLATSISADEVKKLTRPNERFADVRIVELCLLIGLPPEQATISRGELDNLRFKYSYYRKTKTPKLAPVVDRRESLEETTTKTFDLIVGQLQVIAFEMKFSASELFEPVLEISGIAIQTKLIEVTQVSGSWHCGLDSIRNGGGHRFCGSLELLNDSRNIRVISQELSSSAFQVAQNSDIAIVYWINLRAFAEGCGNLSCRFFPDTKNPTSFALSPKYELTIQKPGWSLLRGLQDGIIEQDGFRILNSPQILSVVIIHEDRGAPSFSILRTLAEQWISTRQWSESVVVTTYYEGQMNPESFHVPKKKASFKMSEIGSSKKWEKLFDRSAALQSLFLKVCDESGEALGGIGFQRPCEDDQPSGPGTIHSSIWLRAGRNGNGEELVSDERQQLADTIDASFESLGGIQGWVGHWDWVPRFGMAEENNYTPYEDAIGAGSISVEETPGRYMRCDWCVQNLRTVSEKIWLRQPMLDRVDRQLVDHVAGITNIGKDTFRIDILPGQQLDRLEEALLPILPSPPPQNLIADS